MIQEIIPKSEFLKKYINSFSIMTNDGAKDINYYLFPQSGSTLVLTVETSTRRFNNKIQFENDLNSSPKAEIFGRYLNPVQIEYKGKFNEFSIDFTASGINYFFNKPYRFLAPNNFQEVYAPSLVQLGCQIHSTEEHDRKFQLAEQYFINNFREIKIDYLEKAVDLIIDQNNLSVEDIARHCNVTTRTLNRAFNGYIGCSPQTYRKIVRVRRAIDYKLRNGKQVNYTDVCYKNNFYDSSHFIKVFKSLTNENPSNFFRSISWLGSSKFPVKFC